MEINILQIL